MNSPARVIVASLTLSASTLLAIALHEGWEPVARPPVPGDVATGGFGTTRNEAGSPVRQGENFTPQRGLILLVRDADEAAQAVRRCAPVPMHQHEFDAYTSLTYNIGVTAFCNSTLVRKLRQTPPDYQGACAEILRWDKFQGQPLRGLTIRRQQENRKCLGDS